MIWVVVSKLEHSHLKLDSNNSVLCGCKASQKPVVMYCWRHSKGQKGWCFFNVIMMFVLVSFSMVW